MGVLSVGSRVLLTHPHHCVFFPPVGLFCFFFFIFFRGEFLYFLALQYAPDSSCTFLAPVLESAICLRSLIVLENHMKKTNRIWMLDVLIATVMWYGCFLTLFLALVMTEQRNPCVYTNWCIHTYCYIFLHVTIFTYVNVNMSSYCYLQLLFIITLIILASSSWRYVNFCNSEKSYSYHSPSIYFIVHFKYKHVAASELLTHNSVVYTVIN